MRFLGLTFLGALVALLSTMSCDKDQSVVCDRLSSEAQVSIGADLAHAAQNLACNTDSDCVLAPTSTACVPGCQVVLTSAGATGMKAALAQVDSTNCSLFSSNGCQPGPAPSCPTLYPSCVAGTCTASTTPPAADAGTEGDVVSPGEDATADASGDASSAEASGESDGSIDGGGPPADAGVDGPEAAPADAARE